MSTPKRPEPRRICQGSGGHPAKVSKTTGLVKSHSYRGKHCPGSGQPADTREERRMGEMTGTASAGSRGRLEYGHRRVGHPEATMRCLRRLGGRPSTTLNGNSPPRSARS